MVTGQLLIRRIAEVWLEAQQKTGALREPHSPWDGWVSLVRPEVSHWACASRYIGAN